MALNPARTADTTRDAVFGPFLPCYRMSLNSGIQDAIVYHAVPYIIEMFDIDSMTKNLRYYKQKVARG
jgi:hypothetical protein